MIKVKVSQRSIDKAKKGFEDEINKIISKTTLLEDSAEIIKTDIQFQTRKGYSIPNKGKFDELSEAWKKTRANIAKFVKVSPVFSRNRSNLTITGRLLDSLETFVYRNKGFAEIKPTGTHEPYILPPRQVRVKGHRRKNGTVSPHTRNVGYQKIGERISNAELAERVADQGRPFMGVRDQIVNRIKVLARNTIRRVFKSDGIDAS